MPSIGLVNLVNLHESPTEPCDNPESADFDVVAAWGPLVQQILHPLRNTTVAGSLSLEIPFGHKLYLPVAFHSN